MNLKPTLFGINQLLNHSSNYKEKRIALVCNDASLTNNGGATRVALLKSGFKIGKLFTPEHGLNTAGVDGQYQADGIDSETGIPITSLYGKHFAPQKEDFEGIDLVLFDLPDIGCRFYTYLWTMTYIMEACNKFDLPLIIADRPNSINGNLSLAEGPFLDEENCSSFIGRWSIPIRHSCTLGELARYFKAKEMPGLQLTILPVANWTRNQSNVHDVFTPSSPAMKSRKTALLYPGMGLLEGINVNEGRGTDFPFELCGAPWINKYELHDFFMKSNLPGISVVPISYVAQSGPNANEGCDGLKFSVTDEDKFRPVRMGVALIDTLLKLYPSDVQERLYDTLANPGGKAHLDKLLGIKNSFTEIKNKEEIITDVSNEWKEMMADFLIYQ